ncbi:MAG: PDZ domain-containing protein [Gammaproteobacteria bacterium]|nr:PDZ domain-containing protein [Gammaproteobacteria bacterium]
MPRRLLVLFLLALAAGLTAYLLLTGEPAPTQHITPPGHGQDAPSSGTAGEATAQSPAAAPAGAPAAGGDAPSAVAPHESRPTDPAVLEVRQDAKIARGLAVNPDGGLRVEDIPPGSVVEELRLLPGDIITTINGESVSTPEDFVRIYRAEGRPTQMTVLREGRELHRH